jgi:hypothetical protein
MAIKKNITSEKWYEEPIKKWSAIVTGFLFIAGLGYTFAAIQLNIEFRMEKYELNQEFNEKMRKQIDECKEEKQIKEDKRVETIEEAVKNIEIKLNGN